MMNYDIRIVFEKWIETACQLENEGRYTFALNKFTAAYELADMANDSSKERALEGINRCKNKIKERDNELNK